MKHIFAFAFLLAACPPAYPQAVPPASAGATSLRYSVRYAEMASFGGALGNSHTISPSTSLNYANGRDAFPFSLEYAGGYTSTLSGPPYATGTFQHLLISQARVAPRWNFVLADDVGYRPQSPTTGFSGIPGIGEPIGTGTEAPPSPLILTVNTHVLDNLVTGQFRNLISRRATLDFEASHDFLHYPDENGLDTNSTEANAGFDVRYDARNSFLARYAFSRFTYSGYDFDIKTNTIRVGLDRSWTRSLRVKAAAGPEWLSSSRSAILSASTGISVQADLEYHLRRTSASVGYLRGTSGGSGYMIGSASDTVAARLSRDANPAFTIEVSGGYSHNSALVLKRTISSVYGGIQSSWRTGRNLNAFLNYTATAQNSSTGLPLNVQNEIIHVVGCGIAFTKEMRKSQGKTYR